MVSSEQIEARIVGKSRIAITRGRILMTVSSRR